MKQQTGDHIKPIGELDMECDLMLQTIIAEHTSTFVQDHVSSLHTLGGHISYLCSNPSWKRDYGEIERIQFLIRIFHEIRFERN
jgi:hypothetical protein